MPATGLTRAQAQHLARISLGHIEREYPNKLDHVLTSASDMRTPRELHPVFFGSFDWHSCVEGHWVLAHVYRLFPDLAEALSIRESFDRRFTEENIAAEVRFAQARRPFERPYGWAWLLALAAELSRHGSAEAKRWRNALSPLETLFAGRFVEYLRDSPYPNRTGVHANTAFAMTLGLDYARRCGDRSLEQAIAAKAEAWYQQDEAYQVREPDGWDFLSPALVEAELLGDVLDEARFEIWFGRFLPRLREGEPHVLFQPAVVTDRADPMTAHLDGLNLSRAWCWRSLADGAGEGPLRERALEAAQRHLDAAMPHLSDDYMGEHWLAVYALLALDGLS